MDPLVSVILPVYNGAPYLEEAIQSILNQTYKNFEFIIINDGSTDNSAQMINKFSNDSRIRLFEQSNQGLAATLNRGIGLSKGAYIVRQDQDDISYPTRLEKQVSFMESHPDYGLVGTWASIMFDNKITSRFHKHPSVSSILTLDLLFDNPFVHSSMMIRKTAFDEVGIYSTDKSRQPPEDYELWSRIVRRYRVANIPEVLVMYREVANSMSRTGVNPFLEHVLLINRENLSWFAGTSINDERIEILSIFAHVTRYRNQNPPDIKSACHLFDEIIKKLVQHYPEEKNVLLRRARILLSNIRRNYFLWNYGKVIGSIIAILDKILICIGKYRRLPR
jgi:glycosyltransferase involved in cell wall biosynthesis